MFSVLVISYITICKRSQLYQMMLVRSTFQWWRSIDWSVQVAFLVIHWLCHEYIAHISSVSSTHLSWASSCVTQACSPQTLGCVLQQNTNLIVRDLKDVASLAFNNVSQLSSFLSPGVVTARVFAFSPRASRNQSMRRGSGSKVTHWFPPLSCWCTSLLKIVTSLSSLARHSNFGTSPRAFPLLLHCHVSFLGLRHLPMTVSPPVAVLCTLAQQITSETSIYPLKDPTRQNKSGQTWPVDKTKNQAKNKGDQATELNGRQPLSVAHDSTQLSHRIHSAGRGLPAKNSDWSSEADSSPVFGPTAELGAGPTCFCPPLGATSLPYVQTWWWQSSLVPLFNRSDVAALVSIEWT